MFTSKGLSDKDIALLVWLLSAKAKSDVFLRLFALFEEEFFLFLSVFNNHTIKLPSLEQLSRLKIYVRIYGFLRSYGFDESAYRDAEKKFNKPLDVLHRIVNKLENVLDSFDFSAEQKNKVMSK